MADKKKYNIYVNMVFGCEAEEFPNEYGCISKMKKSMKKIIAEHPEFCMRRYNYDIQESIEEQEEESFKSDDQGIDI